MTVNLLVLLLALEVEDQDLVGASGLHHLSADHGACARADGAFLAGNRQNVIELDGVAIAGRELLNFDHVSGRNPILLSSGANDRVHNSLHLRSSPLTGKDLYDL